MNFNLKNSETDNGKTWDCACQHKKFLLVSIPNRQLSNDYVVTNTNNFLRWLQVPMKSVYYHTLSDLF